MASPPLSPAQSDVIEISIPDAETDDFDLPASSSSDEFDFVDTPPEDYYCPVTKDLLLEEPHQTLCCGHHISPEAIAELKRRGKPKCPFRCEGPLKTMPDKYFERKVKELKVRCHHKNAGCEWVGELRNISTHIEVCKLEKVKCDFSYAGCTSKLRRADMVGHKRCRTEEHLSMVSNTVKKQNVMLQEVQMQQTTLQEQKATLKKQVAMLQKQVATTPALMTSLQLQREVNTNLKQEVELLRQLAVHIKPGSLAMTPTLAFIPPPTIVMTEFSKYKRTHTVWRSPPFYSHMGGYKMRLAVYANGNGAGAGTHVSVYLYPMKGKNDDSLFWPSNIDVTFELVNCAAEKANLVSSISISFDQIIYGEQSSRGHGISQYISHSVLASDNDEYLEDDALKFKVTNIQLITISK